MTSESLLRQSISALQNTAVYSESADGKSAPVRTYDTTLIGVLRGMLGPSKYRFRLSLIGGITSGTATIATNIPTALSQYAEYSAMTALFDECKMHKVTMQLALNDVSSQITVVLGFEPVVTTVTPTGAIVARLPGAELFSTYDPQSMPMRPVSHVAKGRVYGLTLDEGVSAPRICSGLNGTYRICQTSSSKAVTNSLTYFVFNMVCIADFRSRA